jgi:hypothetical protein
MDDLLIFSKTIEEQVERLQQIFEAKASQFYSKFNQM